MTEDLRHYVSQPESDRVPFEEFANAFRGATPIEHARVLKQLVEAEDRVKQLEAELADVKQHYERKLRHLQGRK